MNVEECSSLSGNLPSCGESIRGRHLSAEQMEVLLRYSPEQRQADSHFQECSKCREELENLSLLMSDFRAASTAYAQERQSAPVARISTLKTQRASLPFSMPLRFGLAAAALACVFASMTPLHLLTSRETAEQRGRRAAGTTTNTELSDEALLNSVQTDLSVNVPAPLQLLAAAQSSSNASDGSATATSGRVTSTETKHNN